MHLDALSYLFMIYDDISTYQQFPSLKGIIYFNFQLCFVTHVDACKIFQNIERVNEIITKRLFNEKFLCVLR